MICCSSEKYNKSLAGGYWKHVQVFMTQSNSWKLCDGDKGCWRWVGMWKIFEGSMRAFEVKKRGKNYFELEILEK